MISELIRRFKLHRTVRYGRRCKIHSSAFEGNNVLHDNVVVINSQIGRRTYISSNSRISNTRVGRYCSIADGVCTCIGNHPTSLFVSTFPSFYYDTTKQLGYTFHKGAPIYDTRRFPTGENKYQIIIGNDVWIGSHVLIMPGVKIGDGAIVAAGSVITKDVEPFSIVGGVPAHIIKYRFSQNQIEKLMDIKWWNEPDELIIGTYGLFSNIDVFLAR